VARILVAVVEPNEIYRRGLVVCLGADPDLEVVCAVATPPLNRDADVAVVSAESLSMCDSWPPLILFTDGPARRHQDDTRVQAILPRRTMTPEQLTATVRAAAVGLRVTPSTDDSSGRLPAGERQLGVLRLLANGAGTREIADTMHYSERTVKAAIREVVSALGARTRAQAVAEGIRRGLI
jgi:DNA-binding CsgD family transcriptional regulator